MRASPGTRSISGLNAVTVAAVALVGVFAIGVVVRQHPARWNGGCGDDGAQYCAMVKGQVPWSPFNRRVLAPAIVRDLPAPSSIVTRFLIVDILSVIAVAVATAMLTSKLVGRSAPLTVRRDAAVIAAAVVLVTPFAGFPFYVHYAVLTDPLASAFGFGWLVASLSAHRRLEWFAVPFAAASVATREAWAVPIVIGVATLLVVRRDRHTALVSIATVAGVAVVVHLVFTTPAATPSRDPLRNAHDLLVTYSHTLGAIRLEWMALYLFGLLPLVLVAQARSTVTDVHRDLVTRSGLRPVLLVVAGTHVVVGALGGTDAHRLMSPAAPILVALVVDGAVRLDRVPVMCTALAATVVLWRPFQHLDGTQHDSYKAFSPFYVSDALFLRRAAVDLTVAALGTLFFVLVLSFWRRGASVDRAEGPSGGMLDPLAPPPADSSAIETTARHGHRPGPRARPRPPQDPGRHRMARGSGPEFVERGVMPRDAVGRDPAGQAGRVSGRRTSGIRRSVLAW